MTNQFVNLKSAIDFASILKLAEERSETLQNIVALISHGIEDNWHRGLQFLDWLRELYSFYEKLDKEGRDLLPQEIKLLMPYIKNWVSDLNDMTEAGRLDDDLLPTLADWCKYADKSPGPKTSAFQVGADGLIKGFGVFKTMVPISQVHDSGLGFLINWVPAMPGQPDETGYWRAARNGSAVGTGKTPTEAYENWAAQFAPSQPS